MGGRIMSKERPEVTIARAAAAMDGAFHREQVRRAGMTDEQIRHRIETGTWLEMLPGVLRHAATPPTDAL
jgi:hypothetical protein